MQCKHHIIKQICSIYFVSPVITFMRFHIPATIYSSIKSRNLIIGFDKEMFDQTIYDGKCFTSCDMQNICILYVTKYVLDIP